MMSLEAEEKQSLGEEKRGSLGVKAALPIPLHSERTPKKSPILQTAIHEDPKRLQ